MEHFERLDINSRPDVDLLIFDVEFGFIDCDRRALDPWQAERPDDFIRYTFDIRGRKIAVRFGDREHIFPTGHPPQSAHRFTPAQLGWDDARDRIHARTHVFLALYLRFVVAITNYEGGDNPGSTIITV